MKLCYCDESGTGDEPVAVMVGIIVDAQRMHVTKQDWQELLEKLSRVVEKPVAEIHTRDFYAGNDAWRALRGDQRAAIIDETFAWLSARKHKLVYVGVEKSKFYNSKKSGQLKQEVNTLWRFMGLHLLLCIQKHHQSLQKNKGNTILVFDNEERERMRFTDLVANPPAWTDSYYAKKKKQARLNQIVDVPYFADSTEVHLIQVADFIAFFLRKHAEIQAGYSGEKYENEAAKIEGWLAAVGKFCIPASVNYPATGRCECSDLFFQHAPEALRKLNR